jgi:hypothetical protein
MSKLEIIETEIARRAKASNDLADAQKDLNSVLEQFSKLDEMHKGDEKTSRERLECLYEESRHFTGKWPKVYTAANIEYHPFFNGATDNDCNPYYPLSKIKDKTFDGIGPLFIGTTGGTGTWARDRNYTGTLEPATRTPAISALTAFPNISGEVASCSLSGYGTPSSCSSAGGTWRYPVGSTATELIRTPLTAWRNKIQNELITDLCDDASNTQLNFWQNIINKINTILAAIPTNVSYPNHTIDFVPGSPADLARDYLIANANNDVTNRINYLASETTKEEKVFYGIIKLRLNQGNGSFAKVKATKFQIQANKSLIKDNTESIATLNLLKVKSS